MHIFACAVRGCRVCIHVQSLPCLCACCVHVCTGACRLTLACVWVCHGVSVGALGTCLCRCGCRYGRRPRAVVWRRTQPLPDLTPQLCCRATPAHLHGVFLGPHQATWELGGGGGELELGWLGWKAGTSRDPMWHQRKCPYKGSHIQLPWAGCMIWAGYTPLLRCCCQPRWQERFTDISLHDREMGWSTTVLRGHRGCWAEVFGAACSPGCTTRVACNSLLSWGLCTSVTGAGLHFWDPPPPPTT